MKRLSLFLIPVFSLAFLVLFTGKIHALTIDQSEYNVTIDINKDTTFVVTEDLTNVINGTFHGLRRDIPLNNPNCTYTEQTCGGFEAIIPIGIYDENGKTPDNGTVKTYEVTPEGSSTTYFRFEWEIYPSGEDLSNKEIKWTLKYKIIGGIQNALNSSNDSVPYFYWNALGLDNNESVEHSKVVINLPEGIFVNRSKFTLYSIYSYSTETTFNSNTITLEVSDLSGGAFTTAYEFNDSDLDEPGIFSYKIESPITLNKVYFDGDLISEKTSELFNYFPSGKHTLTFSRSGYKTQTFEVDIKSGDTTTLNVSLKSNALISLLKIANLFATFIGLVFIPLSIFLAYKTYLKKGRDVDSIKTIVPLFTPPANVRPYLLGSLKDEKVDQVDVIGTIIDLAYRGYIKIKEIKKDKNYELTKLEGKKGDAGLDAIEKSLMDALFKSGEKVQTNSLTMDFVNKLNTLKGDIEDELVKRNYFTEKPSKVRNRNTAIGCVGIIFGIIGAVGGSIVITMLLGVIGIFTIGLALTAFGFMKLVLASSMPAKTTIGSKIYNEILGFKMYLHTAERFRLQKLGPDEFEKYLSYAVVFGIEGEWAKKFEGIYNTQPSWFEGTGTFNGPIFIGNFSRGFTNSFQGQIRTVTGASRGSGWSGGGGSFGGFSGGGGGGGGSGGW